MTTPHFNCTGWTPDLEAELRQRMIDADRAPAAFRERARGSTGGFNVKMGPTGFTSHAVQTRYDRIVKLVGEGIVTPAGWRADPRSDGTETAHDASILVAQKRLVRPSRGVFALPETAG